MPAKATRTAEFSSVEVTPQPMSKGQPQHVRHRPCTRRPVNPLVHFCGALFHFATPPIVTYFMVRTIAAGNLDPLSIVLFTFILFVTICFCCGAGCCRASFCVGLWVGIVATATVTGLAVLNNGEEKHVDGIFVPGKRIGIVGAGPSGLTAAWAYAQANPNASITVYETSPRVGGHSDTPTVAGGVPIDIGFIFSTPLYQSYNALCDHYGVKRKKSTISVHYHGDKAKDWLAWINDGTAGGAGELFAQAAGPERTARMNEDLRRFNEKVSGSLSTLELMMPLGMWLWSNGFSDDFFHSALVPMLTPLFVTQRGNDAQSAGATVNHFAAGGFLTFNASNPVQPPVFHTIGGVATLYDMMVADLKRTTPGFQLLTSTEVTAVAPSAGGWSISAHPRPPVDSVTRVPLKDATRPEPLPPASYDAVVMAVNGAIAAELIGNGGDGDIGAWPECDAANPKRTACRQPFDNFWRAIRNWVLRNTEYEWTQVTLSEAAADDYERTSPALYHVYERGVMTGSIDRILSVGQGDYRLRVAPMMDGIDKIAPDKNAPIAKREWQHHRFNLWEHLLVFRVLRHFNDYDGLHIAGDWTQSVGQDAAVRSGIRAACAIGLSSATKAALMAKGFNFSGFTPPLYSC